VFSSLQMCWVHEATRPLRQRPQSVVQLGVALLAQGYPVAWRVTATVAAILDVVRSELVWRAAALTLVPISPEYLRSEILALVLCLLELRAVQLPTRSHAADVELTFLDDDLGDAKHPSEVFDYAKNAVFLLSDRRWDPTLATAVEEARWAMPQLPTPARTTVRRALSHLAFHVLTKPYDPTEDDLFGVLVHDGDSDVLRTVVDTDGELTGGVVDDTGQLNRERYHLEHLGSAFAQQLPGARRMCGK